MSNAPARAVPPRLPPGLYALCDDTAAPGRSCLQQAEALLSAGVRTLQLRLKGTPEGAAVEVAKRVAALCRERGALFVVNDRVDWALSARADGVHLGQEDLPVAEARSLLGPSAIIGATARSLADAQEAALQGASYVGLGPIFATTTKEVGCAPLGLEALTEVCARSPLPVVAISGIGLANIEAVAATGVHAAAVVSDLLRAEDVFARARALMEAFERGHARRTV